jgi:acetyl-CoA acetyltransferase
MRRAPNASSTVTTAGSASGIAATARLVAVSAISKGDSPRSTPMAKITTQIAITPRASRLPKAAKRRCRGVLRSS